MSIDQWGFSSVTPVQCDFPSRWNDTNIFDGFMVEHLHPYLGTVSLEIKHAGTGMEGQKMREYEPKLEDKASHQSYSENCGKWDLTLKIRYETLSDSAVRMR